MKTVMVIALLVFILEMILNNRPMKGAAQFRYRNYKQIMVSEWAIILSSVKNAISEGTYYIRGPTDGEMFC